MSEQGLFADDARTRLLLFHQTSTLVERALAVKLDNVGAAVLRDMGCTARNLRAAELRPRVLHSMGVDSPASMRLMGLDALDLRSADFASDCVALYGAAATLEAFCATPSDAVALAGSPGAVMLGLTPHQLLETTAGAPAAAKEVLSQLPTDALYSVRLPTLLDTGLQLPALGDCGYTFARVVETFAPDTRQLELLGARSFSAAPARAQQL